jgi:tetratricopeptide (TPR) repeat protein
MKRAFFVLMSVAIVSAFAWTMWPTRAESTRFVPQLTGTSREALERTIDDLQRRLKDDPADAGVAAVLADALIRQSRVTGRATLALRAEQVLKAALSHAPRHFDASRMLGVVLLSQHRFREAIDVARRAQSIRPQDAATFGIIGDAHLELGEYQQAFDAMMRLRPSAAAYARVAYAQELQGHLDRAIDTMTMATEATAPSDVEALAWHRVQLGDLYLQAGRLHEASRQYEHARFLFPNHPFAIDGLARVEAARGGHRAALELYRRQYDESPAPDRAARIGELHERLGDRQQAGRFFALAEAGWRDDSPHPALLAVLLATHTDRTADAVRAAEQAASDRGDIYTHDALAWAYFKAGRVAEARQMSARALRTGTRDRRVLYHAAEILSAAGEPREAARLLSLARDGHPEFDVALAPAAEALAARLQANGQLARNGAGR